MTLTASAPPQASPSKNPYFPPERYGEISLEGVRHPLCGRRVTLEEALTLHAHQGVLCKPCFEGAPAGLADKLYLESLQVEVAPSKDTYRALEASAVAELTWYHSTTTEAWGDTLQVDDGFYAHVGSRQAAMDRQLSELLPVNGKGFWLFEVEVSGEASVAEALYPDDNDDYSVSFHPVRRPLPASVLRYVNRWEDLGSISLVVDTRVLSVVNRTWVPMEEARATASLFNLPGAMTTQSVA